MMGAGIGSFIAVWGAVWASNLNERRQHVELVRAVRVLLGPLRSQVVAKLEFLTVIDREERSLTDEELGALNSISAAAAVVAKQLGGMRQAFAIHPMNLIRHDHLMNSLDRLGKEPKKLVTDNDMRKVYEAALKQRSFNGGKVNAKKPDAITLAGINKALSRLDDAVRSLLTS